MDVFGDQWADHLHRLAAHWEAVVQATDTVIVAGDIDWALHLDGAKETLAMLGSWKGDKILLRGNHDYWWSSKTTNRVRAVLPPSLRLLHNNALVADGFNICGAKGSATPGSAEWTEHDAKLLRREELRLRMSLDAREQALPTVVALHYPPFYASASASPYRTILEQSDVHCVVYGHLHGEAARLGPRGWYGDTEYILVAGDALDFKPVYLGAEGKLAPVRVEVTEPQSAGSRPRRS